MQFKKYSEKYKGISEYKNTMYRLLHSLYPHMDKGDILSSIDYSINKRLKDFDVSIKNNYTEKTISMTALEMCDYIEQREPIITSYGVLFKKHGTVPNPFVKVIEGFLNSRSAYKKKMFKYPKGSEDFEKFNLLQALAKIDANGIYGLIGLYMSIIFDLNIAPSVTSTGRSLISSAIMCFEMFLGNNVKFSSLNDILVFIDNVRMENRNWKFDDSKVLGYDGFTDVDEVFNKVMMNCGYSYIPSYDDMDIVYKIIQNCNQIELNRIFYKNNLYCFMDLPIARDLMISIITKMNHPYITPADPPQEIVPMLNELRDYLLEYVFYCHQVADRMTRNKNMIKTISLVSDTDSSFVSLDAWYNYNMSYLKAYDCPILHQRLDMSKLIDAEFDSEELKNVTADNKSPAISFFELDDDGKAKDRSIYDAVRFEDPELDFDFYNQSIIEKRRMIEPLVFTQQENMKFALVNIMCYILTDVINLYMIDFTKNSKSFRGDANCVIYMKNEFFMTRLMMTDAKKCYATLQKLQEGNFLGDGVVATAGIDVLTKSTTSVETRKRLKKVLYEDILTGEVPDQIKIIKDIAILEQKIFNDIKSGSKKYYKPLTVKGISSYVDPLTNQGIKTSLIWNYVKDSNYPAIDINERNSITVAKILLDKYSMNNLKEKFPDKYEKFSELLDRNNTNILCGEQIKNIFKSGINGIAIPESITDIPDWIKEIIDYKTIIDDNISGFPLSSVGISQMDSKKLSYSNIIKI